MKITVLGSGTSSGIPVIGCHCSVCQSENPLNKRMRASILVEEGGLQFLVDTSVELRLQLLREHVTFLDGVFFTHSHADHLNGIDDLRPLTWTNNLSPYLKARGLSGIPLYGSPTFLEELDRRFPYIFGDSLQAGGGKPQLVPHSLEKSLTIGSLTITPIPVLHGIMPVYGYRFNDFVYITDCSEIPKESLHLLEGCRTIILGALKYEQHETHFSIEEAVSVIKKIGPERAWLTHFCHHVDHNTLKEELPLGIAPAYDGLIIRN